MYLRKIRPTITFLYSAAGMCPPKYACRIPQLFFKAYRGVVLFHRFSLQYRLATKKPASQRASHFSSVHSCKFTLAFAAPYRLML